MGQTETKSYNDYGQVARKTDFKGQVTAFTYNNLGRISEKGYFPDTSAYEADTPVRTEDYVYTDSGQRDTVTVENIPEGKTWATDYTYDKNGRVTQVATPQGTKPIQHRSGISLECHQCVR